MAKQDLDNIKTLYDEEIWPKIEEIENKYKDIFIHQELIDKFLNSKQSLTDSKNSYKKEHKEVQYFFSALWNGLTIFPLCGLFHKKAKSKYNELKDKKKQLKDNVNSAINSKLDVHKQIINYIIRPSEDNHYFKYIDELIKLTKIKSMGYINNSLIRELKSQSLIEFDNINSNCYKSSWSVFDNNKIVIHACKQSLDIITKRYEGFRSVSNGDKSDSLYAYHDEPFPQFSYNSVNHFFMQSCSNLEFKLEKMYLGLFKKRNKKNQTKMENEDFEKMFHFSRNDEVQFRMIWTPLAQERMVNDVLILDNQKKSLNQYEFSKRSSFLTNSYSDNYSYETLSNDIGSFFINFASDVNQTYEGLITNIRNALHKYVNNKYKSLLAGFLIPIFNSENHQNIIQSLKIDYESNYYLCYYCFFKMFNEPILKLDTDTFYKINKFDIDESGILICNMNAQSFNKIPLTIQKPVHSYILNKTYSVTVHYDKYVPQFANKNLYIAFINNDNQSYFYNENTLNNIFNYANENNVIISKLSAQLEQLKSLGLKLSIKKSIIALYDANDVGFDKAKPILLEIVNLLNNNL